VGDDERRPRSRDGGCGVIPHAENTGCSAGRVAHAGAPNNSITDQSCRSDTNAIQRASKSSAYEALKKVVSADRDSTDDLRVGGQQ
jgi:hypothetical protein